MFASHSFYFSILGGRGHLVCRYDRIWTFLGWDDEVHGNDGLKRYTSGDYFWNEIVFHEKTSIFPQISRSFVWLCLLCIPSLRKGRAIFLECVTIVYEFICQYLNKCPRRVTLDLVRISNYNLPKEKGPSSFWERENFF